MSLINFELKTSSVGCRLMNLSISREYQSSLNT